MKPGYLFLIPGLLNSFVSISKGLNDFLNSDHDKIINWLLNGDPSIRWQVHADLLYSDQQTIRKERKKITHEGWGARLLSLQDEAGTWANALYSPKWISTTYTLLLLRRLGLDPDNQQAQKGAMILLNKGFYKDGGINFFKCYQYGETCVTSMILSILSYFNIQDKRMISIAEHLLGQQMEDGGWNCQRPKGATHGSFHTTISVLEGFFEYLEKFSDFKEDILKSRFRAMEFLLNHRLFKSHRTGEIVDPKMTRFSFPPRWRYDVMRSLDYFQKIDAPKDERFSDAINLLIKKRLPDGRWNLQGKHAGRVHFEMENTGEPSRWNTLRGMRILKWWEGINPESFSSSSATSRKN